jgi:diguanylate cyclase (GGDEF)-like protein
MAPLGTPDYRRTSSLDTWVGRMPGPVWTLAVYAAIAATNLIVAIFVAKSPDDAHGLLIVGAAVAVGIIVSLVLLGSRTPTWLLHVFVLAIIGMATMLVMLAGSEVGAVTAGFGYLTISLYVSYWMPRVQSLAYVCLMSALYVLAIAQAGWTQLLAPWMLTVATMLIVLFVLSALRQALESVANTDGLTGLINRRGLDWIIATNRTDHRERRRTIVVIDLDNFKELNDRKGHLAGDRALRDFGAACRQTLRPGDLALRTGGDEFVLILERLAADDVAPVIERLHAASTIRWSHGCAEWPPRADFDSAMTTADAALYANKQRRRLQREIGTPETT